MQIECGQGRDEVFIAWETHRQSLLMPYREFPAGIQFLGNGSVSCASS